MTKCCPRHVLNKIACLPWNKSRFRIPHRPSEYYHKQHWIFLIVTLRPGNVALSGWWFFGKIGKQLLTNISPSSQIICVFHGSYFDWKYLGNSIILLNIIFEYSWYFTGFRENKDNNVIFVGAAGMERTKCMNWTFWSKSISNYSHLLRKNYFYQLCYVWNYVKNKVSFPLCNLLQAPIIEAFRVYGEIWECSRKLISKYFTN